MTASASSEESPRWAWFAHHQITFVLAGIAVSATADLTGINGIAWVATGLLIAFLVGESAVTRHTGILCARCIDRVPTDASVQVVRRDWLLRIRHWVWAHSGRVGWAGLAVIVAASWFGHGHAIGYVVWPWLALEAYAQRFHNRVAPWCKYCRNDGWDPTFATTPDPSQVKIA